MQKELTVSQASRTLGITLDYVYRLIYAGKLAARKSEGRWFIPVSAIESRLKVREERDESARNCTNNPVTGSTNDFTA